MKLKNRFLQWWSDIQPFLMRAKAVLADRSGEGTAKGCMEVLNMLSQVLIGNQVFLVERHFACSRDLREAVFTAVENEAKRERLAKESA